MTEQKLEAFRLYYNHTIHPELMRMEQHRKRLLRLLFFSAMALLAIFLLSLILRFLLLTLILIMIVGFYITYLIYRIQKFRSIFKPNVVNLILDFMDNDVNYGTLQYFPKKFISKEKFLNSKIFVSTADEYAGEDYISGKIGALPFELCELNVREFSNVRRRLNYVFRGVFLHATLNSENRGELLIYPRKYRQYMTRSVRAFTLSGGKNLDSAIENDFYTQTFVSYATAEASWRSLLNTAMQNALATYSRTTGKDMYVSILKKQLFVGVTVRKDLLEPFVWQSNVSFDLVREFFDDIQTLLDIVVAFDENN